MFIHTYRYSNSQLHSATGSYTLARHPETLVAAMWKRLQQAGNVMEVSWITSVSVLEELCHIISYYGQPKDQDLEIYDHDNRTKIAGSYVKNLCSYYQIIDVMNPLDIAPKSPHSQPKMARSR